jgi:hypothetical protein
MTRQEYIEMWRSYANNTYFYGHEAKKQIYGDGIYAIDWRSKDGSRINYVRYFFDGNALYITGDLGEAIFYSSSDPVSKEQLNNNLRKPCGFEQIVPAFKWGDSIHAE